MLGTIPRHSSGMELPGEAGEDDVTHDDSDQSTSLNYTNYTYSQHARKHRAPFGFRPPTLSLHSEHGTPWSSLRSDRRAPPGLTGQEEPVAAGVHFGRSRSANDLRAKRDSERDDPDMSVDNSSGYSWRGGQQYNRSDSTQTTARPTFPPFALIGAVLIDSAASRASLIRPAS